MEHIDFTPRDSLRAILYYNELNNWYNKILNEIKNVNLPYLDINNILNELVNQISICLDDMVVSIVCNNLINIEQGNPTKASYSVYKSLFIQGSETTLFVQNFFEKYNHIGEIMYQFLSNSFNNIFLLLNRLKNDWKLIEDYSFELFGENFQQFSISKIYQSNGETHCNGQKVLFVELISKNNTGKILVYKPFGGSCANLYKEFINVLPDELKKNFKLVNIIFPKNQKDSDYYWSEFIKPTPCNNEDEISNYWNGCGALLFISELLGFNDGHFDNLMAVGSFPIIIDTETFFQPSMCGADESRIGKLKETLLIQDPPKIFNPLSPNWVAGFQHPQNIQSSNGLTILNERTQYLKIDYEVSSKTDMNIPNCIPSLNGDAFYLKDYFSQFRLGYEKSWIEIKKISQTDEFISQFENWLENVKESKIRLVLRPTSFYSILLKMLSQPSFCINKSDQIKKIRNILEKNNKYLSKEIINSEIKSLLRTDVPSFYSNISDSCNFVNDGYTNLIQIYDSNENIDKVYKWDIKSILKNPPNENDFNDLESIIKKDPTKDFDADTSSIIECSLSIAQDVLLEKDSLLIGNNLSLHGSFYNGLSGVLVFLSAIYQHTKLDSVYIVCEKMVNSIKSNRPIYKTCGGAFDGATSDIYAILFSGIISNNEDWVNIAKTIAINEINEESIKLEDNMDLIGGISGCLATLYVLRYKIKNLNKEEENHFQNMIDLIINKLINSKEKIEKMNTGVSHGYAGVCLALSLFKDYLSNDIKENINTFINEIVSIEDSYYSYDLKEWNDKRSYITQSDDKKITVSWCYGSPGISISRYAMGKSYKYPNNFCIETIGNFKVEEDSDLSVCCGSTGKLDVIMTLDQLNYNYEVHESIGIEIVKKMSEKNNWSQNSGYGFFKGISGIGYTLLRLKNKKKYPSPLNFMMDYNI